MKKKKTALLLTLVLGFSLCFPSSVFAKNNKVKELKPAQEQIQQTMKKELKKKAKTKKTKATEPDAFNKGEIGAYQFPYLESIMEYLLCGGNNYYNSNYSKKVPQGLVKMTVQDPGTLMVSAASSDKETTILTVYDKNKKRLGIMEDSMLQINVKKGDVYYFELPKKVELLALSAIVFKDHSTTLPNECTEIQTGTGTTEYRSFKVSKRSELNIMLAPVTTEQILGSFSVQKYVKGSWENIDHKATKTKKTASEYITIFSYGLNAGNYRFVSKMPKDGVYMMAGEKISRKKRYATTRKKAQYVENGDEKADIFTASEQKARWYKIKRTTIRKKKQYIEVDPDTSVGKIKVSVYKKGIKKPLKTKVINGASEYGTFKFSPKQGVGTYYVKIQKIGKKTNGSYLLDNRCK